jgi:hypothetical protein
MGRPTVRLPLNSAGNNQQIPLTFTVGGIIVTYMSTNQLAVFTLVNFDRYGSSVDHVALNSGLSVGRVRQAARALHRARKITMIGDTLYPR